MIIYVLGTPDAAYIKVGKTTNLEQRIRQHEGTAPDGVERKLLAAVLGMDSDERFIHRYFSELQAGTKSKEWFHASESIREWVRWLRHQPYVATSTERIHEVDRVSSDLWLPNQERVEPPPPRLPLEAWSDLDLPDITGDDYYTNHRIIDVARAVMGGIDLDPASHPDANSVVRARMFYTHQSNGLAQDWKGRVWCNPPFHQWDLWGRKIIAEWLRGEIFEMCVLIANRSTSTLGATRLFDHHAASCITRGRIPFWGPKAGSPDDGHTILYYGPKAAVFAEHFRNIGPIQFAARPH